MSEFLVRMLKERRCKQSCTLTEEKKNFQLSHSWILEEIKKYNLSKLTISDDITFICGIQTLPVLSD